MLGVVSFAGLAPLAAEGLDWYAGMTSAGADELRAAAEGRAALATHLASAEFDQALAGEWSSLGANAGSALPGGFGGLVDDDLAFVSAWGCDPGQVIAPVLVVPGSHGEWLARRRPSAELLVSPGDGHISVLGHYLAALGLARGPRQTRVDRAGRHLHAKPGKAPGPGR